MVAVPRWPSPTRPRARDTVTPTSSVGTRKAVMPGWPVNTANLRGHTHNSPHPSLAGSERMLFNSISYTNSYGYNINSSIININSKQEHWSSVHRKLLKSCQSSKIWPNNLHWQNATAVNFCTKACFLSKFLVTCWLMDSGTMEYCPVRVYIHINLQVIIQIEGL